MTKFELIKEFFEEIWTKGNLELVEQRIPDTFKVEGLRGEEEFPRSEFPDLVETIRGLTGPLTYEFTHFQESDDWITFRFIGRGDGPDGATPISVPGIMMSRIENDRIVENHTQFDYLVLFEQLGRLPQDTLAMLMSGQTLRPT